MDINKVKQHMLTIINWIDNERTIKTDLNKNKTLVQAWKQTWKRALRSAKTDYERAEISLYLDTLSYKIMHMVTWDEMKKLVRSICIR